ncbi:MAG: hypothetical protein II825_04925 [Paludibacteraceae bacterium]|nr:hypothetical protein [Paludibacteraceae bacterium]
MKKYLLICVTYHSDKELQAFLESVRCATERVKGKLEIDIEIVDNGAENLGYLGGALPIYNAKAKEYDYISISNVDMELAPDFFEQLLHINSDGIGWIAPDIYTPKIDRHENPYMLSRPTKLNFFIWNIIYSNTWIYRMYHALYLLKNKKSKTYPACDIYAGHGSFMLFTKAFVLSNLELHFPGFMYGEEIYMAELVRKAQLKVAYCSTLRIANIGNINTGSIEQKLKSQWSQKSLRAIRHMFFD